LAKKHEKDVVFNLMPLSSYSDFDKLIDSIKVGTYLCETCYDKERFVENFR
jgi:hypothetical protein